MHFTASHSISIYLNFFRPFFNSRTIFFFGSCDFDYANRGWLFPFTIALSKLMLKNTSPLTPITLFIIKCCELFEFDEPTLSNKRYDYISVSNAQQHKRKSRGRAGEKYRFDSIWQRNNKKAASFGWISALQPRQRIQSALELGWLKWDRVHQHPKKNNNIFIRLFHCKIALCEYFCSEIPVRMFAKPSKSCHFLVQ